MKKELKYGCNYFDHFTIVDNIAVIEPNEINEITWYVGNTDDLSIVDVKKIAVKVFKEIEKHINPINFVESKSYKEADIKMIFAPKNQDVDIIDSDGSKIEIRSPFEFDGQFGTLAIGYLPLKTSKTFRGTLIFDKDENWNTMHNWDTGEIDLEQVMLHEILHVLGLRHSKVKKAVMYPSYDGNYDKRKMHNDDIEGLRTIYKEILLKLNKKTEKPIVKTKDETIKVKPNKDNNLNKKNIKKENIFIKILKFLKDFLLVSFILCILSINLYSQNNKINLNLPQYEEINRNDEYKPFTLYKSIGYITLGIGAFTDGVLEGYQIDGRRSFERKWGVEPISFFGSESWKTAYVNNDPRLGFKSKHRQWLGAFDFYHVADDTRKTGYILGGAIIGIGSYKSNKKWWHHAADFAIGATISAAAKNIGYRWVRYN